MSYAGEKIVNISKKRWARTIENVRQVGEANNAREEEERRLLWKKTQKERQINFKYNEDFYRKFLDYLSDSLEDFYWNDFYNDFGEKTDEYCWYTENIELRYGFTTFKSIVEDVLQHIQLAE